MGNASNRTERSVSRIYAVVLVTAALLWGCAASHRPPSQPELRASPSRDGSGGAGSRPDILCFCEVYDLSPQSVLLLDDNVDIVKACRTPRTTAELRASGIAVTDSQLALLRVLGLLQEQGAGWQTSFPVLYEAQTRELVAAVVAIVPGLARAITPELDRFRAEVLRLHARSLYVLLFSYVFDNLVFDRFRERNVLAPFKPAAPQSHWAGTVWMRYPRRGSVSGTNSFEATGLRLNVVWSRGAGKAMGALMSDADRVEKLATELAKGAGIAKPLQQVFAALGVLDDHGTLLVPIVSEHPQDPLFAAATALSAKVAGEVLARLPPADLQKRLGLGRAEDALVIAYHEIMWELLAYLESTGVVQRPRILATPGAAVPADAADLVYVVRARERPADSLGR